VDWDHPGRITSFVGISVPFREVKPRRKVRIVKRRIPSRAAGLSLAAVAVTGVFAFIAWRWWNTDDAPIVASNIIEDAELDWKCEQGHEFAAQGQVGGRPCPTCGEMAYPFTVYQCASHGAYEVKVQFERDAQGRARVVLYRVGHGQWTPAQDGPKCPRCELVMTRSDPDPLEGRVRPKRKSSGS
jgi:hypothetical protein